MAAWGIPAALLNRLGQPGDGSLLRFRDTAAL